MKKVLLATGVAVLALASVASAQGYSFNANLTVGSTGADVVALQTYLIANGFDIPAITSGAAAKGYFGSQTQAAAKLYQASRGIPNTGFVGPLTRAALNSGAVASSGGMTPVMCPVGYTCVANPGTTPVVGTPVGIGTPGIPGTVVASLWTSPSDGTTVYKGQSYDVVAYKLQASASDMAVSSIALDFDNRLWLYAGAVTIKDDSGVVVGQVSNLNSSNFSELTVGSEYRLTVPISNYVVKAAQTRYLTVSLSMLAVSDRSSATLTVLGAQFRAVDGTGVTDTQAVTGDRTFSFQGSGAGQVVVTVDSSSPLAQLVQISSGGQTQNIPLAVYNVKVQNAPANLRSLSFTVHTNGQRKPEQLFSQYNLKIGSQTFGANSVTPTVGASSTVVVFTNFGAIPLAADTYVPVTLYATAQQDTNSLNSGTIASTSLVVSGTAGGTSNNPAVEDQSYSTLSVNGGTFISSDLTFTVSSANVASQSSSATPVGQNATTYNTVFTFTMTAGNDTLFVSPNPVLFVATSTTGGISGRLTTVQSNPDALAGDTTAYYVIPAGASRQFTISGSATGTSGDSGVFKITAVNYSTIAGNALGGTFEKTINYNLGGLQTTSIAIP